MKAAVVRRFEDGPRYESFESPPAPAGDADEVVVDVLAAALSPRVRSGASGAHYTSRGVLPLVPGIDGVGRLANGQRVYFVGADDTFGTMAERTVAHRRLAVPLPAHASSSVIAAGMLPAISSWVALTRRAPLARGQRVLVLGATGAAGLLAVQIAKHLGAGHVIAVGRSAAGLARARALGADEIVRLTGTAADGDAVASVASAVDIVLDYLWGTVTSVVLPALCKHRDDDARALHWVEIGSMAGDDIALSSALLRKRDLRLVGSGQGSVSTADLFAAAPPIVAAFADGTLAIGAREVPLADVATAWRLPDTGERIVFVP